MTRPKLQSASLVAALEGAGATVILMPTIEIAEPDDFGPLDQAIYSLSGFDWVIFTSVNAVEAVGNRVSGLGLPKAMPSESLIAAVGPATAAALEQLFRFPDVVPDRHVSDDIAGCLGDVAGKRILLPQADLARQSLADALAKAGAIVTAVTAYRIVRVTDVGDLPDEAPDYITLTSSEAARGAKENLARCGRSDWLSCAALVCIGPITADTVRELGYAPAAVAVEFTTKGLVEILTEHAAREVACA